MALPPQQRQRAVRRAGVSRDVFQRARTPSQGGLPITAAATSAGALNVSDEEQVACMATCAVGMATIGLVLIAFALRAEEAPAKGIKAEKLDDKTEAWLRQMDVRADVWSAGATRIPLEPCGAPVRVVKTVTLAAAQNASMIIWRRLPLPGEEVGSAAVSKTNSSSASNVARSLVPSAAGSPVSAVLTVLGSKTPVEPLLKSGGDRVLGGMNVTVGEFCISDSQGSAREPYRFWLGLAGEACAGVGWRKVSTFYAPLKQAEGTQPYCVSHATNPTRARLERKYDCNSSGWTQAFVFYAYETKEVEGLLPICVADAVAPVRFRFQAGDNCGDAGWTQRFVFYAYKQHIDGLEMSLGARWKEYLRRFGVDSPQVDLSEVRAASAQMGAIPLMNAGFDSRVYTVLLVLDSGSTANCSRRSGELFDGHFLEVASLQATGELTSAEYSWDGLFSACLLCAWLLTRSLARGARGSPAAIACDAFCIAYGTGVLTWAALHMRVHWEHVQGLVRCSCFAASAGDLLLLVAVVVCAREGTMVLPVADQSHNESEGDENEKKDTGIAMLSGIRACAIAAFGAAAVLPTWHTAVPPGFFLCAGGDDPRSIPEISVSVACWLPVALLTPFLVYAQRHARMGAPDVCILCFTSAPTVAWLFARVLWQCQARKLQLLAVVCCLRTGSALGLVLAAGSLARRDGLAASSPRAAPPVWQCTAARTCGAFLAALAALVAYSCAKDLVASTPKPWIFPGDHLETPLVSSSRLRLSLQANEPCLRTASGLGSTFNAGVGTQKGYEAALLSYARDEAEALNTMANELPLELRLSMPLYNRSMQLRQRYLERVHKT